MLAFTPPRNLSSASLRNIKVSGRIDNTSVMAPTQVDYLVIGGGLTGCALASRLHQRDESASVLIVEAGSDATGDARTIDPKDCFALSGSELDWAYKTLPQTNTKGRSHYNVAAKTLGGGSTINYGGWTRGGASDYNEWARIVGDTRWSYERMLPYFKRSEHHFNPDSDPQQHGFEGPMHYASVSASDPQRRYPLREPILAAWTELGVKHNPDTNNGTLIGISEIEENWHNGLRQPAHQAYSLDGVKILTNTMVHRILFSTNSDGKHVVSTVQLEDQTHIRVRKEVILSAGAHRTPQLLMLSGIGPAEQLARHNIPIIKELPQVGQNMIDHFALFQFWKVTNPSQGLAMGSPQFNNPAYFKGMPNDWAVKEPVPSAILSPALSTDPISEADASALLQPSRCHLETVIIYAPAGAYHVGLKLPMDGTHIASSVMLLLPTSRGDVSLASASAADSPVIDPNYYATAADRAALIHGVQRVTNVLLETTAGKSFVAGEVAPPGMPVLTPQSEDHVIDERIRAAGVSYAHASGTAAMGKVVDADLRVYGVEGLRVADASVIPVPIAGHPQATLYALAELAADIILGESDGKV